jgi:anti-sigma regulatory factor (Ser/Thr protein kinase)
MLIPSRPRSYRRSASADWREGFQVERAHEPADLHADLPRQEGAPGSARMLATAWCDTLNLRSELCDTMRLLVSEVVTNAVLHSEAPPGTSIKLAASLSDGTVMVTVAACGTGPAPSPRTPHPLSGGYGLFLLEKEADQWGVDRGSEGTRVWFRIDLSRDTERSGLELSAR